jgi:oligosaccharide translocation protein RFT1
MSTSIASGAVLLVVLQLSTRLVTFALNQALLRWTTPAAFGTASIQLEFLLNTVLFLSREGMRGAVLREKLPQDAQKLRSLHNSTWLPLLAGLPISFCITALYLWTAQSSTSSQPHFYAAVFLYIFSALLELASEPFFLDAQLRMDFKLRVSIEGSAVIVKSLLTLGSVVLRSQLGLLAFAIGQLGYSLTILVHYLVHQSSSIWPVRL